MADKEDVVVNNVTYRDVPGIRLTAAGGGTVTYTLVDYPIAIEKGGTGATTSADALIQLSAVPTSRKVNNKALSADVTLSAADVGAVAKSGDTMTGTLTAPEMRIKNDSYPSFYYQTTSGIIGRTLANHNSHNMSFREMKSGQHFDSFTLPTPTLTEETDNYYDIVTTKGNYAMGGTLSASAPISSYHSTTPSFAYKTSASGSPIAESAARANTRQIFFREYASDTAYHEDYLLPEHSTGATGNATYGILTTKDHPAYTVQTLDWSSSNYINANYDVWVEKALDTVRFQGLFTFTNLTANTTVEIGTLPVGYRPNNRIERTIGISLNASWNSPGTIGAQFVLVSVYSNGIVKINPGSTPNTNSFWIDMTWAI